MIDKSLSKREARVMRAALMLSLHNDDSLWNELKFDDKILAKGILSDLASLVLGE